MFSTDIRMRPSEVELSQLVIELREREQEIDRERERVNLITQLEIDSSLQVN